MPAWMVVTRTGTAQVDAANNDHVRAQDVLTFILDAELAAYPEIDASGFMFRAWSELGEAIQTLTK